MLDADQLGPQQPQPISQTSTSSPPQHTRRSSTNTGMPFSSMVLIMAKWALASVPALLIFLFLSITLIGGVFPYLKRPVINYFLRDLIQADLQSIFRAPSIPSSVNSIINDPRFAHDVMLPAQKAYLSSVIVRGVRVAINVLGRMEVTGEIKTTGDKSLCKVELTIYYLDIDGIPVYEKNLTPVDCRNPYGDRSGPLISGYTQPFSSYLDDARSDWSRKVDVKVTSLKLQ